MDDLGSNPELWIAFISASTAIIVGGLTSLLTYVFTVRSKLKDLEFEKNRDLHEILSNLLEIWHQAKKLELLFRAIGLPTNYIFDSTASLFLVFKQYGIDLEDLGQKLEESIKLLKNKDAITYYNLFGLGNGLDAIFKIIHEVALNPDSPHYDLENGSQQAAALLKPFIDSIEDSVIEVSKEIGGRSKRKVKGILRRVKKRTPEDTLTMLNEFLAKTVQSYMRATLAKEAKIPSIESIINDLKKESSELKVMFKQVVTENYGQQKALWDEGDLDYVEILKMSLEESGLDFANFNISEEE